MVSEQRGTCVTPWRLPEEGQILHRQRHLGGVPFPRECQTLNEPVKDISAPLVLNTEGDPVVSESERLLPR